MNSDTIYNNPTPGNWMKLYYMSDIQWTFLWFISGLPFISLFLHCLFSVCVILI